MRKTTTEWESQFFFALWDRVVMRALESEPRNIGYCAYLIRSELDGLIRDWPNRDDPSPARSN